MAEREVHKVRQTKEFHAHLRKVNLLQREKYHPLVEKIHKKHEISKKTLFYVKEYGPHSHVAEKIIKESVKILLLASLVSAFGGFALEHVKTVLVSIMPLIILFPALNDMIGDYGTIFSSRFATLLHEGKVDKKKIFANKELAELAVHLLVIAAITAIISAAAALLLSGFMYGFSNYAASADVALKIFFIAIVDVVALVALLLLTSVFAGLYFFDKKEDPNNFLIPITTSVADFGNMIVLALLVTTVF